MLDNMSELVFCYLKELLFSSVRLLLNIQNDEIENSKSQDPYHAVLCKIRLSFQLKSVHLIQC